MLYKFMQHSVCAAMTIGVLLISIYPNVCVAQVEDRDTLRFEITQQMVEDVRIHHVEQMDNYEVRIGLAAEHHSEFYQVTEEAVDQVFELVFEGEVVQRAVIRNPIPHGRVSIIADDRDSAEAYAARLTGEE